MMLEEGYHLGISFPDYLSIPCPSVSLLKRMERGPGHVMHELLHPRKQTPAMLMGSAPDCLLSEGPEAFERAYSTPPRGAADLGPDWALLPDGMKLTTKDGKAWRADQEAAAKIVVKPEDFGPDGLSTRCGAYKAFTARAKEHGQIVLTNSQMADVWGMHDAVMGYELARGYVTQCETQPTIIWRHETGLLIKSRPDFVGSDWASDLKTTGNASPRAFGRIAHDLGYHIQEAAYRQALAACGRGLDLFAFVVVERGAPYAPEVYRLGAAELELGAQELHQAAERFLECSQVGTWPLSSGEINTIVYPSWAYY
jgi:hypothetical protein